MSASLERLFEELRPAAFAIAYRMLGSVSEAEDVVQEAFLRLHRMLREGERVESPRAYLATVVTRLCIDQLRSARARRERYVGEWLPEPLPDHGERFGDPVDPADRVTLDESVNMALLVVLDALTPAERVAFVLHDVFRYPFGEVAGIVGRSPAACRQLASSARRRIEAARTAGAPPARQSVIVAEFKRAWEAKDITALINLLDPNVTATADGGGRALTFVEPIRGGEQVAQAWVTLADRAPATMTLRERTVNGRPGLVSVQDGVVVTVFAFDVADDRIRRIWVMRNPDKLGPWTTVGGVAQ
jgi:RNA polymerase sigma factor (sigma-70 family)